MDDLAEALKRATDRAEMSENRIRTLIEAIPVGLLIASGDAQIEAANPSFLSLFRCTYDDLVGRNLSDFFQMSDGLFLPSSNEAEGDKGLPKEVIAVRPDRDQFPAEIVIRSFVAVSGSKFVVVVEDVTARHALEQMKEEFVSMISHDLRTPLTSIQCFLDLVCEGFFDDNPESLKKTARGIESDTTRLINMINRLLDMHKMESGRLELFIEVIPCAQIIDSSVQSVASLAEKQGIQLDAVPVDRSVHVTADNDYAVQVLVNLLSNAVKFSGRGDTIRVTAEVEDSLVKVSVTDYGPGIDSATQKKLFNRFEQASVADARLRGGTGLGLAISKEIVQRLGGTIGVESSPGSGSTFWFTLPRVDLSDEKTR